jgi:hypothetical protein
VSGLLSTGSGGERLLQRFLAVHPSVSVSLIDRCICYGGSELVRLTPL